VKSAGVAAPTIAATSSSSDASSDAAAVADGSRMNSSPGTFIAACSPAACLMTAAAKRCAKALLEKYTICNWRPATRPGVTVLRSYCY